jgi:hypothetical protein
MFTSNVSITTTSEKTRRPPETFNRRFVGFLRECRRRMRIMKTDFERAGDGSRSRARSAERLRDTQAWSRTYDEGSPNGPQAYQRQDTIRMRNEVTSVR